MEDDSSVDDVGNVSMIDELEKGEMVNEEVTGGGSDMGNSFM